MLRNKTKLDLNQMSCAKLASKLFYLLFNKGEKKTSIELKF